MTTQETPNDRATTFQAVPGNQTEQYSGATLLVSAYAVLWVVVFVWVALVWRRQGALDARLTDLERVLDRAAADKPASKE
jgi:CcmD family protein